MRQFSYLELWIHFKSIKIFLYVEIIGGKLDDDKL